MNYRPFTFAVSLLPTTLRKIFLMGVLGLSLCLVFGCNISPQVSWQKGGAQTQEITQRSGDDPLPHHLNSQPTVWVSPEQPALNSGRDQVVWIRSDAQDEWQQHAIVKAGPSVPLELPGEGTWGVLMTPVPESEDWKPASDAQPDAIITVDLTAPLLITFEVIPEKEPGKAEVRWRSRDRSFGVFPVALETSDDQGESWQLVTRGESEGSYLVELPVIAPDEDPPSRLVRVRVVDKMGNATKSQALEISRMPVYSYPRILEKKNLYLNESQIQFEYDLGPGKLNGQVEFWLHEADEETGEDQLLGIDADSTSPAIFELDEGAHTLSIRIRDAEGQVTQEPGRSAITRVVVDRHAPKVTIRDARAIGGGPYTIRMIVEAEDVGEAGLERIQLYGCIGDGSYQHLGDYEPGRLFEFEVDEPKGIYSIFARAIDLAGNQSEEPPQDTQSGSAMAKVALGVPDFEVEILSFSSQAVLKGGSRHYVFLKKVSHNAGAQPQRMTLSYSFEGDTGWNSIVESQPFSTRVAWELPKITAQNCRLKVEAWGEDGLKTSYITPDPFAIDSEAPEVNIIQADDLGAGKVLIHVDWTEDTPSGIKKGWVYFRNIELDSPWQVHSEVEPHFATYTLDIPPGFYALKIQAEDRVGNRDSKPKSTSHGDLKIKVLEVSDGALSLQNFHGGQYRGGESRYIFWDYQGPEGLLDSSPFSLSYSVDGGSSWLTIEDGVDLPIESRKWLWNLPKLKGIECQVRLRARLKSGAYLSVRSARPFLVESRAPRSLFIGPSVSSKASFEISFQSWSALDPLLPTSKTAWKRGDLAKPNEQAVPVVRVDCYAAKIPDGDWFLAGTWEDPKGQMEVTSKIKVKLSEGAYRLALVSTDLVGNSSKPSHDPKFGGGKVLIDSLRPEMKVLIADTRDIYTRGEEVSVRIRVTDEHLPSHPVSLTLTRKSEEGELEPQVLEPRFPARGTYILNMPEKSGTYTLGVDAQDVAGNSSHFERVFFVMPPQPRVSFRNFRKTTYLRGGEPVEIKWDSRYVSYKGPTVALHLSRDGGLSWTSLAEGLENSGSFLWEVPPEDFQRGRLRIEVRGDRDNLASSISGPIIVSTKIPKVGITRIESHQSEVEQDSSAKVQTETESSPLSVGQESPESPSDLGDKGRN